MRAQSFFGRMMLCLSLLWFALSGVVACAPPIDPLPDVPKGDVESAVKGNNDFAIRMYKQLTTVSDPKLPASTDNIFFSPYSLSSALTMTYAGATDDTATEMRQALSLALPDDKEHAAQGWLNIDLNNRGKQGDIKLNIANRIWGQQNYKFIPDFLTLLDTHYRAGLEPLDFKTSPEPSRQIINQWIEKKTEQKIKDLIPQGEITTNTRLVLTNAIYFKGTWLTQFKPEDTKPSPFYVTEQAPVQAPMMSLSKVKAQYADLGSLKALALPYKGKTLSMVILLPKDAGGLKALEQELSREKLDQWFGQMSEQEVSTVKLPKFEFKRKKKLNEDLKALGMKKAFEEGVATFRKITLEDDLFIGAVFHEAFIKVDEEGSEAAAATAVIVDRTTSVGPDPTTFIADRPFLFLIRDNSTQSILFLGRVYDPTKS